MLDQRDTLSMIRVRQSILTMLTLGLAILSACTRGRAPVVTVDSSTVDDHGTLHVTRVVPVPATVSPDAQKFMSLPRSDMADNTSVEENRANAEKWQETLARDMQAMYPTTIARDTIAGVPVRAITPPAIPPEKRDRVLLNVHGGGFQADWGSVAETIPIASLTQTKVIGVLYRLAPEHPFPAAVEDTIAVYKELLKTYKPRNIVLYGTSAGAILTCEVAVHLKQLGLPLPAALGIFSGTGDLARKGDSVAIFGLWGLSGPLFGPAKSPEPDPYVGSTDPRDPILSPIFGDLKGLPPTLFLTSERDLLLSGTVNLHRAFRNAGVQSDLVVFDGLHHAFWNEFRMPESIEADHTIADFFDQHLGH
jgi:monoterpene epsilon-lactone hydrolase